MQLKTTSIANEFYLTFEEANALLHAAAISVISYENN